MKTNLFCILKYNPFNENYLDIYSDTNYRKVLNLFYDLEKKYPELTFVLVEVKQC